MMGTSRMIGAEEVAERLDISKATAYRVIRDLNREVTASGRRTLNGKIDEQYFEHIFFMDAQKER